MMSRCNSPIPEMMVCAVSSSVFTRNDGSSWASLLRAMPIFSWSALVFGSTATEITGSGKSMRSRMIGLSMAHRVSPVVTSFMPISAAMSPARTSLISSRWLACICTIRPTRSFLPFTELSTASPEVSTPEYTRAKVRVPTKGSVAILNASAEKGSSSSAWRSSCFSSSSGSVPLIAGISDGAGR
ncbi:Uncharacterised protein [Acinetobacter baumannii]|nr:Uncharacterised protein [Acinetobacter baumannii]